MGGIIYEFYIQPMNAVYLEAIAMYVIWLMGMFLLRGRAKRIIAGIVLVFSVILNGIRQKVADKCVLMVWTRISL